MAKVNPGMEKREREAAMQFFRYVMARMPKEARQLFTQKCVVHNPYTAPNADALLDSMADVQKSQAEAFADSAFDVKHVLVDGNMVAVYTTLQSRSDRSKGMRQVHLFRFNGDKIAEYWDVTQAAPDSPHASEMF